METTTDHINGGGGICGTCHRPAAATYENQGYSDCCNDRIEYGDEARMTIAGAKYQEALSEGKPEAEVLNSWGGVEDEIVILRELDYRGQPAVIGINENGNEGLYLNDRIRRI